MEAGGTTAPEGASGNTIAPRQLKAWLSTPGRRDLLAHLRELESTLLILSDRPQASAVHPAQRAPAGR